MLSSSPRVYSKSLLITGSLLKAVSKGNLRLRNMSSKLDTRSQSHEMGCRGYPTTAQKELNGLKIKANSGHSFQ